MLPRPDDRAVLVMFAHPRCPCTRASIAELAKIMARYANVVAARVVFMRPQSMPAGWEKTDLWSSAQAIPGVTVTCDVAGHEAERFRAETSGLVVLYDPQLRLRFYGGITVSRGHVGDNVGRTAIEATLGARPTSRTEALVFGCGLRAAQAELPIHCSATDCPLSSASPDRESPSVLLTSELDSLASVFTEQRVENGEHD